MRWVSVQRGGRGLQVEQRVRGGVVLARGTSHPGCAIRLPPVGRAVSALCCAHGASGAMSIHGPHGTGVGSRPFRAGVPWGAVRRCFKIGGERLRPGMGWDGSLSNTCQIRRHADPMCQRLVPQAAANWTRSHATHH